MPQDRHLRHGLWACAAAALLSVFMPGTGHWAIRARIRPSVAIAAIVNLVAMCALVLVAAPIHDRADLAELIADRAVFAGLGGALVVLAATRLWTAVDSAWQARPTGGIARRLTAGFATAMVVVGGVAPLAVAADYVWQTDQAIENVFSTTDATTAYPGSISSGTTLASTRNATPAAHPDVPVHVTLPANPTTDTTPDPTNTTTTTAAAPPTLPPMVAENRVNVLLLGGDAGPGRWSLRTDSMIVVSIDPITGDTAMISVPRNLTRLPFPPGTALAQRYPRGFDDLANAVYTRVNQQRDLAGGGDDAGSQAIKLGMAQLLGMPINYYVLVDMAGFVEVVDALGGIDIDITRRVPSPGNPANAKHRVPAYIEAGPQHLDGTLTLAYSRSRSADNDYQRMARQRCVLAAIATAATPTAVASGLTDLVAAFGDAVRTDIPRDRLGEFAQLVDRFTSAGGLATVRTLHLVPPLISSSRWDAVAVRQLVASVITPGAPAAGGGAGGPPAVAPLEVLANAC